MNKINKNKLLILFFCISFSLMYIPIFFIIIQSFNESSLNHEFTGFSFKWYIDIFNNKSLLNAIKNTWLIAILSTIISTILGTIFAIGISSLKYKYKKIILLLNKIPIMNADIIIAISLVILFIFLKIQFGMFTMLLAHIFFSLPFIILSVLPKLDDLSKNLYDAALDLGYSKFQIIMKVTLPNIKSGIITGALIVFTMSIDDFIISYFTTGNGFNNVSIWIYSRLGKKNFSPSVYAYNSLIIIVTIFVIICYYRYIYIKRRNVK